MPNRRQLQLTPEFPHLPKDVLLARVLSHTRREEETGCLLWTGCRQHAGYGRMRLGRFGGGSINYSPNKLLFFLTRGQRIEEPQMLKHTCKNHSCIEPDHMIVSHRDELRRLTSEQVWQARIEFWGESEAILRRKDQESRNALHTCAFELGMAESTLQRVLRDQSVNPSQWRRSDIDAAAVRQKYQEHCQENARRDACIKATHTYRTISIKYGINIGQAQKMLNGTTYRHVPMPKTAGERARRSAKSVYEITLERRGAPPPSVEPASVAGPTDAGAPPELAPLPVARSA